MPRVSAAFFALGVLCVLAGMIWGMIMGATEDMVLAPAHAHLNLLGWVTMGLYGTFYALTRQTMSEKLAWTNLILSGLGVVILIPFLVFYLKSANPALIPGLMAGEILTVGGLVVFGISVSRELLRKPA